MLRVALFLPGITTDWKVVDFLLDTGAGSTCVHPKDAIFALGVDPLKLLDPTAWPEQRPVFGVGGNSVSFVVPAHYGLLEDDGSWETFQADIALAEFRLDNQRLPSLLGWDVLQRYQLSIAWQAREIKLLLP